MALRNNPYLPLYVNDFLSDEKLLQVSAEATGLYIRLMCIMHKSEQYGKILLKQIQKQNKDNIINFATVLTKQVPYDFSTVKRSLVELLSYDIVAMENDSLIQRRMVKDNEISEKRALSGKIGGQRTQEEFAKANAKAKFQANTDIDNDIGLEDKGGMGEKEEINKWKQFPGQAELSLLIPEMRINNLITIVGVTKHKTIKEKQVLQLWEVFKGEYFTGKKYYQDEGDVYTHFLNWGKMQKFEEEKNEDQQKKIIIK